RACPGRSPLRVVRDPAPGGLGHRADEVRDVARIDGRADPSGPDRWWLLRPPPSRLETAREARSDPAGSGAAVRPREAPCGPGPAPRPLRSRLPVLRVRLPLRARRAGTGGVGDARPPDGGSNAEASICSLRGCPVDRPARRDVPDLSGCALAE